MRYNKYGRIVSWPWRTNGTVVRPQQYRAQRPDYTDYQQWQQLSRERRKRERLRDMLRSSVDIIDTYPDETKEIIYLYAVKELSAADVAKQVGKTRRGVENIIYRVRKDLKKTVGPIDAGRADRPNKRERQRQAKRTRHAVNLLSFGTELLITYSPARPNGLPYAECYLPGGAILSTLGKNAVERLLQLIAAAGHGGKTYTCLGGNGPFSQGEITRRDIGEVTGRLKQPDGETMNVRVDADGGLEEI